MYSSSVTGMGSVPPSSAVLPVLVTTNGGSSSTALTVMVTSAKTFSAPSSAVSLSTYDPAALKLAVVSTALVSVKVTVPGPLTRDQVVVSAGGLGSPSSVTVPSRVASPGRVMV